MNGNYYNNGFVDNSDNTIIDVLKRNIGKKVRLYLNIPNIENNSFDGIIESVGNDYIIISNPTNGEWQLFLMIYLGYITFEENIKY